MAKKRTGRTAPGPRVARVPTAADEETKQSDNRARRIAGRGGHRVVRGMRRREAVAQRATVASAGSGRFDAGASGASGSDGGAGRRSSGGKSLATTDTLVAALLEELRALGSAEGREGMARYGINVANAFGVSIFELRRRAKGLGHNHELARALWATGNHEARLLACFVDDPALVTLRQMEAWVRDFDSWDICDQATTSLFDRSQHAWPKAAEWAGRSGEWERRAGFALMAGLAVHDETATNAAFAKLLPLIERGACDERNFVKKAVSWALRNIGKRSRALNAAGVSCAERTHQTANAQAGGERGGEPEVRSARWVAADAFKELTSAKVRGRVGRGPK